MKLSLKAPTVGTTLTVVGGALFAAAGPVAAAAPPERDPNAASPYGRVGMKVAVKLALAMCGLIAGVFVGGLPIAWADSSLPYTDTDQMGYLGFCDEQGHQVTSGDIRDQPFVWTAVSSVPAPDGYGAKSGMTVLNAYQPRPQVPPAQWSGQQLTSNSTYTNSAHPMARFTGADQPLLTFLQAYPPQVDGLIQLRMYFSAPGVPVHAASYPATSIRIEGNHWHAVDGGPVDCHAGQATSFESKALPKAQLRSLAAQPSPRASGSAGARSATASDRSNSTADSGAAGSPASGADNGGGSGSSTGSASGGADGGLSASAYTAIAVGATALAALALLSFWRRRIRAVEE